MGSLTELINPIIQNPTFILGRNLCWLFMVVLYGAIVFWTYRDAVRRGAMGWFWALVVAIFFPVFPYPGLIIYLIARPAESAEDVRERELEIRAKEAALDRDYEVCPACYKPVDKEFLICPSCMKKLRKSCVECGRALNLPWTVCPYCKTKQ
jgi:hypothetical protein